LEAIDYSGFVDSARERGIVQHVGKVDKRAGNRRDGDPAVNGCFAPGQRAGAVRDDANVAVLAPSADLDSTAPRADLPERGC
jgi:hypothetical protein